MELLVSHGVRLDVRVARGGRGIDAAFALLELRGWDFGRICIPLSGLLGKEIAGIRIWEGKRWGLSKRRDRGRGREGGRERKGKGRERRQTPVIIAQPAIIDG